MNYHIVYIANDGRTEVGRVRTPGNRASAISAAAVKYNVARSAIKSVVGLPEPRPVARPTRACGTCEGTGTWKGPYGEPVRCRPCGGSGKLPA